MIVVAIPRSERGGGGGVDFPPLPTRFAVLLPPWPLVASPIVVALHLFRLPSSPRTVAAAASLLVVRS